MNVKGYHFLILAEIQGMMRMTCFGAAACAEPFGVITLTKFNHVPDTRGQISALFNNGTPGRPYSRRITAADMGKNILEGVHIFLMKTGIENRIHQVRIGCALGIDIEHQKAVIAVCFRNTGNGLKCIVKSVRRCSGRVDTDADQRIFAACAENITVFRIKVRHIKLESNSVVILEGIHALNPIFEHMVPRENMSRIYVSVKQGIKDNEDYVLDDRELRCIRRIVRDSKFRNTNAEHVLDMWDEVIDGEMKYIRPYRYTSDFTVNTIHIYEPCVLKKPALERLSLIDESSPLYPVASRLISSLERFEDIDESLIPKNSLIREFLGGGSYVY